MSSVCAILKPNFDSCHYCLNPNLFLSLNALFTLLAGAPVVGLQAIPRPASVLYFHLFSGHHHCPIPNSAEPLNCSSPGHRPEAIRHSPFPTLCLSSFNNELNSLTYGVPALTNTSYNKAPYIYM